MTEYKVGDLIFSMAETLGPCWMYCDGRLLRESEQPDLHAVIGDTYNKREFGPAEPQPRPTILQRLRLRPKPAPPKRPLVMVDPPGWFRIPDLTEGPGTIRKGPAGVRWFVYLGGEKS